MRREPRSTPSLWTTNSGLSSIDKENGEVGLKKYEDVSSYDHNHGGSLEGRLEKGEANADFFQTVEQQWKTSRLYASRRLDDLTFTPPLIMLVAQAVQSRVPLSIRSSM